jgi:tetratricopeptide (TPR) repeat protein
MNKAWSPSAPKRDGIPKAKAPDKRGWPWGGLGAGAIFLLVLAVYFPALRGPFVWDDPIMLDENPLINKQAGLHSIWLVTGFPLSAVAFWLQWLAWGRNPVGYHLVNVLLHASSAVLLWRALKRLKIPGAWLAGVVFAAHPVCVASVAWISELKNTLSLPFYLLSILWYLRSEHQKSAKAGFQLSNHNCQRRYYGLSLFAFLLACLAKTSVVMLPAVLLGLSWWQRGRITRRDVFRIAPFFAVALALGLMTVRFQAQGAIRGEVVQTEDLLGRLAGAGWAVWFYLGKALLPVGLSMVYPRWQINSASPLSYLPLLLLGAAFYSFWRYRRGWGRHTLFGLACFAVTLFPVLGFFDMYYLVYSRVADHWQYLPLTGVVALVVGAGSWWLGRRLTEPGNMTTPQLGIAAIQLRSMLSARVFVSACLVMGLSVLTWRHARIFASEETLWRDTLKQNPAAWCAHNNLGNALAGQGKTEEAIVLYLDALRVNPDSADAHNNLGLALAKQGKIAEALAHHAEAVRLKPNQPKYQFNLGIVLARQDKFDDAIAHYTTALRLQPGYADVHNNLANVLWRQGRIKDSLANSLEALRLKPDLPEAHFNAANALATDGKIADAAAHFLAALKLKPDFAEARHSYGILLAEQGKLKEAAEQFAETVRLNSGNAAAQSNLGNALAGLGKPDEAIAHYQEALRLEPNDPQTHNNLANTYVQQGKSEEAVEHYRIALRLKPDDPEPHYNLALTLARQGKRDEAIKHLSEALRLRPGYAEAQRQFEAISGQRAK